MSIIQQLSVCSLSSSGWVKSTLGCGVQEARLTFLVGPVRELPPDHVLTDVILLGQVEELADLAGPLGPQATGNGLVCQPRDVVVSWCDERKTNKQWTATPTTKTDEISNYSQWM